MPNYEQIKCDYNKIFNDNNYTEIYLDIETVPDFVRDSSTELDFPNIVLIGAGFIAGSSWQFKYFSPNIMYNKDSFEEMMTSFRDFIYSRKNKVRIYHWSGSEGKDLVKYTNGAEFIDLCELIRKHDIGIPGAFSYKLKEFTNALFRLGQVKSNWCGLKCKSGTDAVGATIAAVVTSKKYYIQVFTS